MVREFKLPDVGEGINEGEIVSWLVEEGDAVSEDQPVAEVETDKAIVEVPAPVDGTVREILADEGEMVKVGSVIITFDVEGEASETPPEGGETAEPVEEQTEAERAAESDAGDGAPASEAEASAGDAAESGAEADAADAGEASTAEGRVFAAPSARRLARELGVDLGDVEGSGPSGRVTEQDVRAAAEASSGAEASESDEALAEAEEPAGDAVAATREAGVQPAAEDDSDDSDPGSGTGGSGGPASGAADRDRTLAAPATRRVAEEEGVDIDAVPAVEERDGEAFVTEAAVREYAEEQRRAQQAQAEQVGAQRASAATGGGDEDVERVQYKGVRRTIAERMAESKYTAPHVTHHETAVVEDLVEARSRLKAEAEERGFRLTYMPFVMKAAVAALKQHPVLNAELDEDAGEILKKHYYNIGIATATDAGLMVPVVDAVDRKGMLQLSSEANELVQKARDRSISRDELQGSTFTVTNFGAIGGEYATPIINYPEVAVLGIGELKQRPVVEDGEVVARWTLPLSISVDHRVVDGADVARFAETFIEYVENPELLLLE